MADLVVTKKIRLTQEEADELKRICELSGLKESEVIRTGLSSIQLKREKVPKDLMDSLYKIIEIEKKLESVFEDEKETGNLDVVSLKVYLSYIDKLCKELRFKYLKEE